jgi:hypothetical protein
VVALVTDIVDGGGLLVHSGSHGADLHAVVSEGVCEYVLLVEFTPGVGLQEAGDFLILLGSSTSSIHI